MPLPTTKAALLESLRDSHRKLDKELADIPESAARRRGVEGSVSPCDVAAYQIGWGRLLLGWDAAERRGDSPEMPAPGFKWNQLGPLAASFHDARRGRSLRELRDELASVVADVGAFVSGLSEDDLFATGRRRWAGAKWPVAKWVQVNTVAPYRSARSKLRRWKKPRMRTSS